MDRERARDTGETGTSTPEHNKKQGLRADHKGSKGQQDLKRPRGEVEGDEWQKIREEQEQQELERQASMAQRFTRKSLLGPRWLR